MAKKKRPIIPKRPIGRPTEYKPEYCQELIEFMGKGYSQEAFCGHVKISKQTLYNWYDEYPDFLDAKTKALVACQMFWEQLGVNHILNESESFGNNQGSKSKSLNASVWIFNMKNRFKWIDRKEVSSQANVNQTTTTNPEEVALILEHTKALKEFLGKK